MRNVITVKSAFVAAALAIGTVLLPSSALQAIGGSSCIISGSTDRPCASKCYAPDAAIELVASSVGFGLPIDPFESRCQTRDFGAPLKRFRSNEPRGCAIIIR